MLKLERTGRAFLIRFAIVAVVVGIVLLIGWLS